MIRLTTLGATDLRDGRGHVVRDVLSQPKRLALLVYLAVESRRQPVSRDKLLSLFWPESDSTRARNTLSQSLHHLRQAIGTEAIDSTGATTVQLKAETLWCDTTAFAEAIERGEPELALDLYRGDFCPALFVGGAQELEAWIEEQRTRFRRQALAAARALAERLSGQGDSAAARVARRALELRPDDEADVRAMLTVLERAGDATGALLAFEEYTQRLARDLEVEPEAATRQLIESIRRRREEAVASPEEPATATPRVSSQPAAAARPRLIRRIAAAIAILGFVSAVGIAWNRSARPDATGDDQTVAVFPFTVRGSDDLLYLQEGLVDLLSAKLDGSGGLRALDPHAVVTAIGARSDGDDDVATARRLGARRYIRGDVVVSSGRVEINASLFESGSRRTRAVARMAGDTSALFELVNGLAGQLLAGLTDGRDTTLTTLAAINTTSLPALKAFLAGEQALRAGNDTRAATFFREAAELDTTFALAQYRLALVATWVRTPSAENPTAWAARAARNASRLTPLARDLLTAYQGYRELRAETAERIYRNITTARPENVEAWLMLGETLFHYNAERGRSIQEAREPFERVLGFSPANVHALIHLARLAAAAGDRPALDSLARIYTALHQDAERLLEIRALVAFVSGTDADVARIAEEARATDDWVIGSMIAAARNYAENLDVAPLLAPAAQLPLRFPNIKLLARGFVVDAMLASGRWSGETTENMDPDWLLESQSLLAAEPFFALDTARTRTMRDQLRARRNWPALQFTVNPRPLSSLAPAMQRYLIGVLSVRLGDTAAARAEREALQVMPPGPWGFGGRELALALRGAAARSAGDARGALEAWQEFRLSTAAGPIPLVGLAHWGLAERFATAELLLGLGRDSAALALYESFNGGYDTPFVPAAHIRRGEIQQRLGNQARARFHFMRAARMLRDADPEFRWLLDRARRGLADVS